MGLSIYADNYSLCPPKDIEYEENDDVDIGEFRDKLCSKVLTDESQMTDYVSYDLDQATRIIYGYHYSLRVYCHGIMRLFREYMDIKHKYLVEYRANMGQSSINDIDNCLAEVDGELRKFDDNQARASAAVGPAYTYFIVTALIRDRNDDYMKNMLSKVGELCHNITEKSRTI